MDINEIVRQVTEEVYKRLGEKQETAADSGNSPESMAKYIDHTILKPGASIEDVADILGNSPEIVRQHYAPWVKSRQDALDERLKMLWAKPKLVRVK